MLYLKANALQLYLPVPLIPNQLRLPMHWHAGRKDLSLFYQQKAFLNGPNIFFVSWSLVCLRNPPPKAVVMYLGLCRMVKFAACPSTRSSLT